MSHPQPQTITGGCLCEAIRYTITSEAGEWPPPKNAICLCTMCRKHSGALIPVAATIPTKNVSPPLQRNPAFKLYRSSTVAQRGFCIHCGSSICFLYDDSADTEMWLGTLDEEVFCGGKVPGTEVTTKHGTWCERKGGVSKEIRRRAGGIFMENGIDGVTDWIAGPKYWNHWGGGKEPFTGTVDEMKKRMA
ncbi:hypothetical protein P152DRAFT_470251 [Eremomyces bilateralis CBS 781.70]|uniref:CENP-V/GFA domain-containing protein n=1 Tax=Eremomyces bilateralis CBS 781.70 TaxID=1392243 RepID=A0A6G1GE76_9PEZI|nr:uncharacterized protein P152DRAFT_470251 [Eremomyces bilateralis CBS 781.70]KAF1816206.1 hypothetical protein P152DRAFT_470251 [Eremomyces bilateralis CBS 781.70]